MERNHEEKIEEINMKKILFLLLTLCISLCTYAQALQEVRGVETKLSKEKTGEIGMRWIYSYNVTLTNQNSFPVSVDVELWARTRIDNDTWGKDPIIVSTKQFELAPKETYRWKAEECEGISGAYVKYKAYKSPNLVTELRTDFKSVSDLLLK